MATLLYRIGRFSYRRHWTIIGVWLVLAVGILGGSVALGGQTQESFAIPGTESQDALDRLEAVFPSVAGASAQAVVVAQDGTSVEDPEYRAAIEKMDDAIADIDGIDTVVGPFSEYAGTAITEDGSMARSQIQFDGAATDVTEKTLDELTETAEIAEEAGLTVAFGGQVFQDSTFGITITEVFGVIFAAVVLLITFGSLVAAGMPLVSALLGVGIVVGGISAVSAFTTISSTAPLLALMIGLAVGIDYSLFILSRHRNQLAKGEDPEESAGTAVGTAGTAVVFAGATVIIALLGLLVVGIPFLSVMGVGAAFAVLVAIGVATTLLPALLGLAKGRLTPKEGSRAWKRANVHEAGAKPTMGLRWVRGVMKRPVITTVGVVAVLGALAIPALSLDLSLPDGGSQPEGSTQREAFDLIDEGFGPGYNGPLVIAIDITQTTDIQDDLEGIRSELEGLDDVESVSQGLPDEGLDTAIIQVTPSSSPTDQKTKDLVQAIRDLAPSIEKEYDTPIAVTGSTAVGIDISNRLSAALLPFGAIVVGLSIILLMMVFRSVLVPLKAAVGFLLSVVASFGVVVGVFQWGWLAGPLGVEQTGPVLSFMPILLMAVLFGLAMDYEVFLVSGMREEYVRTGDARAAVERGYSGAARVVTAAALIMFFVFFAFVPEGSGAIKSIALGLAVGVAFDAFLVRMTLVPAVMTLLGRAAWWIPKWLGRILPDLDIEGEHLREHREAVEWIAGDAAAIRAEGLVVGTADRRVGPFDLSVPTGAVLLVSGEASDRRILTATVAGRLDPLGGRLQVGGHPLPSESGQVARTVAMASVAGPEPAETELVLGELLAERLRLTQPWNRAAFSRRRAMGWIGTINRAVDLVAPGTPELGWDSPVGRMPQLQRAIAIAAVAMAEGTRLVALDQQDSFASSGDQAAFLLALADLARESTTIVLGSPLPHRAIDLPDIGRQVVPLDLTSATRGALL